MRANFADRVVARAVGSGHASPRTGRPIPARGRSSESIGMDPRAPGRSCTRSQPRPVSSSCEPLDLDPGAQPEWTGSIVASTPGSWRLLSTLSQACSSSPPPDNRDSSPLPSAVLERASLARRRCRRPEADSGRSIDGAGANASRSGSRVSTLSPPRGPGVDSGASASAPDPAPEAPPARVGGVCVGRPVVLPARPRPRTSATSRAIPATAMTAAMARTTWDWVTVGDSPRLAMRPRTVAPP